MKKVLFITMILLLSISSGIKAQEQNETDKLTAYKIAFFTKRLDLTPAEAEKFWPVYNDYSARKSRIQVERITMMRYINQNEVNISDQEMASMAEKLSQSYIDESNLTITFAGQIEKILTPRKRVRLYQAEAQYKLQLLKELNERREEGGVRQFKKR
jgi:Spy/CpxP family protein refolding chaperone